MIKFVFILFISLFSIYLTAAVDEGLGHVGSRRSKRWSSHKTNQKSDWNGGRDSLIKDEDKKDDKYYAEQYSLSRLTLEEKNFADKKGIPLTQIDRIKNEYKKEQQKLAQQNSIQRIETPEDQPYVAWKFISKSRDNLYPTYSEIRYSIPKYDDKITEDNIICKISVYNSQFIELQGKDKIDAFSKNMFELSEKMNQWIKIAQKNNVTELEKDFEGFIFSTDEFSIKAKFIIDKNNNNIEYVTKLILYYEDDLTRERKYEKYEKYDYIGLVNLARATQLDKVIPILSKKVDQINNVNKLFK